METEAHEVSELAQRLSVASWVANVGPCDPRTPGGPSRLRVAHRKVIMVPMPARWGLGMKAVPPQAGGQPPARTDDQKRACISAVGAILVNSPVPGARRPPLLGWGRDFTSPFLGFPSVPTPWMGWWSISRRCWRTVESSPLGV